MAKGQIVEVLASGKRRTVAKPKKPGETVYVQLPDERPAELYEFEDEAGKAPQYLDAALQGVMTELGSRDDEAKVTVKRITIGNGVKKEAWLYECHPREFSFAQLQEDYGEGDYRITIYGQQEGSNYKIIHADKKLTIGGLRGGRKPKSETGTEIVPASNPNDLTRAIASAISGPMQALVQTLAGMMPKATSRADVIAEMSQMATLMQMLKGEAAPAMNPLDALEKAVALMQANRSAPVLNEDGEVSPNAVLVQGIQLVKEFFSAARESKTAQPAALPAPARPAAPAAPVSPAPSEDDAMKLMLKLQMKMFLNAAVNQSDPLTYATILYEQAPDEIIAKLQGADWFAELTKIEPGFSQHKAWCEQVRAEVLAALAEESSTEIPPLPLTAPGDKGISSADAPASGTVAPGNAARDS